MQATQIKTDKKIRKIRVFDLSNPCYPCPKTNK